MAGAEQAAAGNSAPSTENHGFITQIGEGQDDIPDFDELEAQAARAALAEEAGATMPDPTPPEGADKDEGSTQQPKSEPAPSAAEGQQAAEDDKRAAPQEPPAIPFARFNQVYRELQQTREEAARLEGRLQAQIEMGKTAAPAAPPAPDPRQTLETRVQTARQALNESSEKLDRGEITQAEHTRAQFAYEDEMQNVRAERSTLDAAGQQAKQPAAKPAAGRQYALADQQILENQVAELESQHPYLLHLSDQHLADLKDRAYALAEAEGTVIEDSPRGDMVLRDLVARLSDRWGPRYLPDLQLQPAQTQAPAAPAGQPQLSPAAKAREAKLAAADAHPPDTATLGAAGSGDDAGVPTDAQISQMTDVEIEALPAAVREKILARN